MEYNVLGNSGLKVSSICIGTSTFGGQKHAPNRPSSDDATAGAILDRFTEAGGNYIDTADMYSYGEAEQIVGQWLSGKPRDKFVVTSKVGANMSKDDPNSIGLGRKHLVRSLENTLANLQSDYVDVYLCHRFDPLTPLETTFRTLNDFVRSGKVRHIGVSNFLGYQLQKATDLCKYMGLEGITVAQSEYNLLTRTTELELVPVCRDEKISLTPWGGLKGGWLTGKYSRDMVVPPEGSRIAWSLPKGKRMVTAPSWGDYANDRTWDLLDTMGAIAKAHDRSTPQVALRWLLQQEVVPSVVVGARTMAQLDDCLGAGGGWRLSEDQMMELEAASAMRIPDPYYLNYQYNQQRL